MYREDEREFARFARFEARSRSPDALGRNAFVAERIHRPANRKPAERSSAPLEASIVMRNESDYRDAVQRVTRAARFKGAPIAQG